MPPLITLTTDFGTKDPYVGAMKGVISSLCPQASIVDLSHSITRHSIKEASLFLLASVPYFPPGSIHVVVIDPGVGTERKPIAVSSARQIFVCPDNGLLTYFIQRHGLGEMRIISHPDCMLPERSPTFDGRDLFAPSAARLACGFPFANVGPRLKKIQTLRTPPIERKGRVIRGRIIHVDVFGNLITNIPRSSVTGRSRVVLGGMEIPNIEKTYGSVAQGEIVALWGSFGFLEVAVNCGSAADQLECAEGDRIEVHASLESSEK